MNNEEIIAKIKTKYNLLNVNEPIWNDLIDKVRAEGCYDCHNPEPQILCRWCGRPKEEHDIIVIESIKTYFCADFINTRFEPAPQAEKMKR